MEIGPMIIYNLETGYILNNSLGQMSGTLRADLRPEIVGVINLPYGYNEDNFETAIDFHVDVETKTVVVDSYIDENGNIIERT